MNIELVSEGDVVVVNGDRDFLEVLAVSVEFNTVLVCGFLSIPKEYSFDMVEHHWKKEQSK